MFENSKKKLIHFNTSGNIAEDFLAHKRKKSAGFRAVIRLCFLFHCIAAVLCVGAGYFFSANLVSIAVCAGIDIVIAFFAAGGEMTTKGALCGLDFVLAVGGVTAGLFSAGNERLAYFICAGTAVFIAAWAIAEMIAAHLRDYLQSFPVENLQQTDYSLMSGAETKTISQSENSQVIENIKPAAVSEMPPKQSEMRELAQKLSEVLNAPPVNNELSDETAEKNAEESSDKNNTENGGNEENSGS